MPALVHNSVLHIGKLRAAIVRTGAEFVKAEGAIECRPISPGPFLYADAVVKR